MCLLEKNNAPRLHLSAYSLIASLAPSCARDDLDASDQWVMGKISTVFSIRAVGVIDTGFEKLFGYSTFNLQEYFYSKLLLQTINTLSKVDINFVRSAFFSAGYLVFWTA